METVILVLDILWLPMVLLASALFMTIFNEYLATKLETLTEYVVKKGWL